MVRLSILSYEMLNVTDCILNGKIESQVHTHQKSVGLISFMDKLRADWDFKYPFE